MFGFSSTKTSSYRHCYDIDGMVRIKSSVRLPELEFFRSSSVGDADIVIRTRPVGGWAPRMNIAITNGSTRLEYREHLGPLFANFSVDMEDPVVVTAGPLLALSPHVLYTNVIEPLLRFILASKGRMLLHAACISIGGQAIIPPPKYKVTDLVTCVVGTRVRMESLYVIERGTPSLTEAISHGTAVDELLENTEDAYGFPPYSSLAPHLVIAGNGPERLRKLERHILSSALSKVSVQRIRVPDYSWPELINAAPATVGVA